MERLYNIFGKERTSLQHFWERKNVSTTFLEKKERLHNIFGKERTSPQHFWERKSLHL